MELTEALNYMKTIIDNGKQRKNRAITVKEGLLAYLKVLVVEDSISKQDCEVLKGIVRHTDDIMDSIMTVDEAFVRSLCNVENVKYTSLKTEEGQVVQQESKKNNPKISSTNVIDNSKKYTFSHLEDQDHFKKIIEELESKPQEERVESKPWDTFPYKPDGRCGRFEEASRKAAYEEWYERTHPSNDGINPKCRH